MSESSEELKRIANAIEEILRLVKLDQCNRYSGHAGPGPANNDV